MNKFYIIGNGMSAYIIASCLNYKNIDFEIIQNEKMIQNISPINLLKYKDKNELKKYFEIFGIEINNQNIKNYTKNIKVGYLYKNQIYDKPNKKMINNYLKKQNRNQISSSMSDGLNNFKAINLSLVFNKLKKDFKNKIIFKDLDIFNLKHDIVFNTVGYENYYSINKVNYEYIVKNKNEIEHYDYVYDCNNKNKIKRITKNNIEYIEEPKNYDYKINNYYDSFKVNKLITENETIIYIIGRYATKTQTKQEDIIKYVLNLLEE